MDECGEAANSSACSAGSWCCVPKKLWGVMTFYLLYFLDWSELNGVVQDQLYDIFGSTSNFLITELRHV